MHNISRAWWVFKNRFFKRDSNTSVMSTAEFCPVFQTSLSSPDVDYDMSLELIELGNNSMNLDDGWRMLLAGEAPDFPSPSARLHGSFSCLSLNFQLFVLRLFQQFHVDYATLWLSARSPGHNKELHVLSCVPFTPRCVVGRITMGRNS